MGQAKAVMKRSAQATLALALLSGLAACRPIERVKRDFEGLVQFITTGRRPEKPKAEPSPGASGASDASRAQANAQLLQEVYRVVFQREPWSKREFAGWVDSLNQGASLEGVYNGLTHSSEYRKLEKLGEPAAPRALEAFVRELALLEEALPEPTVFGPDAARPLPLAVPIGEPAAGGEGRDIVFGAKPGPSPAPAASPPAPRGPEQYRQLFAPASFFTLKRVLGEEALKVLDSRKKSDPKALAAWYAVWATRLAGRGVDFGLAPRNRADEAFHRDWAQKADPDRLSWEVLNRLNRILNAAYQVNPETGV